MDQRNSAKDGALEGSDKDPKGDELYPVVDVSQWRVKLRPGFTGWARVRRNLRTVSGQILAQYAVLTINGHIFSLSSS